MSGPTKQPGRAASGRSLPPVSGFVYAAIEGASGRSCRGTIKAHTPEEAISALKARGLAPTALTAEHSLTAGRRGALTRLLQLRIGRVAGAKQRALFTRQLATLTRAGMPLVRSLDVLAMQAAGAWRGVIGDLADTLRTGGSLSDGLAKHPGVFDRLYLNMVRAGEASGALALVLERLAVLLEKSERLKRRLMAALTYPLVVLVLALGIVGALMVVVVPKFEQIFAGLLKGQPLPALTRGVLGASRFVQEHSWLLAAAIGCFALLFAVFRRTEFGRSTIDWLKLQGPGIGPLCRRGAVARFTRTLGTLVGSGVPILEALWITRETSGNAVVADAITRVHDRVKAGETLAVPLAATGVFPTMVTSLVQVGEETGALPAMLTRIADDYDEDVDTALASFTSMLEPLLIVLLAGLVGTVVVALFLPIVSIVQHLQ